MTARLRDMPGVIMVAADAVAAQVVAEGGPGGCLDAVGRQEPDLAGGSGQRLGFKREFSAAFRTEAARVPYGRARFLRSYGAFDLAAKLAPFTG